MHQDWKSILAIIDDTFSFAEQRLVEVRKDTIAHMRRLLSHSTHAHLVEESNGNPVSTTR